MPYPAALSLRRDAADRYKFSLRQVKLKRRYVLAFQSHFNAIKYEHHHQKTCCQGFDQV